MAASEAKTPQETLQELKSMLQAYALQETVEPLKNLRNFVAFGFGAALLGSFGIFLLLLGVLRVLQTETGTTFTGSLTWVPYLITLLVAALLAGLSAAAVNRRKGGRA